jgi:hypothetical protein
MVRGIAISHNLLSIDNWLACTSQHGLGLTVNWNIQACSYNSRTLTGTTNRCRWPRYMVTEMNLHDGPVDPLHLKPMSRFISPTWISYVSLSSKTVPLKRSVHVGPVTPFGDTGHPMSRLC